MTAKERLREIIEGLDDEQAERARRSRRRTRPLGARPQPRSLGHGTSGRGELSEKVDDILAEGFGR